ncbi:MAG: class B sortase [Oscillospiraceae bacterium]|nr:class B sortase [Oscillospiraceae bacterium]
MSKSDEVRGSRYADTHARPKKSFAESFIPSKNDTKKERENKLITLGAAVVLVVCLVILGNLLFQYIEAKLNHDKVANIIDQSGTPNIVVIPRADKEIDTPNADPVSDIPAVTEPVRVPLTLTPAAIELLAENPDTVGSVKIPGCVSEVVVKGTDNLYYLDHNFYGKKRQVGTCFADYRNNLDPYERSDNIILYAHNNKDGSMFGNLDYYRWNPAYWQDNPFVYFNTNYTEEIYVIVSSFVTNTLPEHDNGNVFDYQNYIDFSETYSYDYFMDEITKRSQIITGVECTREDKYLTLSTCSTEFDESRHILVARKLRDDETTESFDLSVFEKNSNPKWPAIYYKYNGGSYVEE